MEVVITTDKPVKENNYKMERIIFNTKEETLLKLKELEILTKSKKEADLDKLVYKFKDNTGKLMSKNCQVIGYNHKETPKDCINRIYQNLILTVDEEEIHINIDFFKDMQSKGFSF